MKKYFRVWLKLAANNFASYFANPLDIGSYLAGKIIRFVIYFVFLLSLVGKTKSLAGFSAREVLLFYLVFFVIDAAAQAFLRGTYDVANRIKRGQFDYYLAQPVNVLFRGLSCIVDVLDFLTLIPLLPLLAYIIWQLPAPGISSWLAFLALLANGLIIALAFHILAAAVAVITFESHNVMFFYRNLLNMMRFPLDIYARPLQFVMTTIIPVGVMAAFPVKALLGILSPGLIAYSFILAGTFLFFSLKSWNWAIRRYQSASS